MSKKCKACKDRAHANGMRCLGPGCPYCDEDEGYEHQCGGPQEACLIPGCSECGTPSTNMSDFGKLCLAKDALLEIVRRFSDAQCDFDGCREVAEEALNEIKAGDPR